MQIEHNAPMTKNAQAICEVLRQRHDLTFRAFDIPQAPAAPADFVDGRAALQKLAAHLRTGLDAGSLTAGSAAGQNFDNAMYRTLVETIPALKDSMPAVLAACQYHVEVVQHGRQLRIVQEEAKNRAQSRFALIEMELEELAAVINIRDVVGIGAEALQEASAAPNKLLANVALQMAVEGTGKASEPLKPVIRQAALGLMLCQAAGVAAEELTEEDLLGVAAELLLSVVSPAAGAFMVYIGDKAVRVEHGAAELLAESIRGNQPQGLMPVEVLARVVKPSKAVRESSNAA